MSATSMIVTATARTKVPSGSPIRGATTSAWQNAASTVALKPTAPSAGTKPPTPATIAVPSTAKASSGHAQLHHGIDGFLLCISDPPYRERRHAASSDPTQAIGILPMALDVDVRPKGNLAYLI